MAAQHLTVFEAMLDGDLGKVMMILFNFLVKKSIRFCGVGKCAKNHQL